MTRDPGPLPFVLALGGCFMLLLLVTVGPLAGGRGRPTELQLAPIDGPPAVRTLSCRATVLRRKGLVKKPPIPIPKGRK